MRILPAVSFACAVTGSAISAVVLLRSGEPAPKGPAAILAIPIVLTFFPLLLRQTGAAVPLMMVASIGLFVFAFVTGFSVGLFFFPSAVAMLFALAEAAEERRQRRQE